MNAKSLIAVILVLAVVIVGAYFAYTRLSDGVGNMQLVENDSKAENVESEGEAQLAPDFTVYDADGNAHKLSDFRGKPVVLNFWASWCGYCVMEMPEFENAWRELGDEVEFLMVNVTSGRETLESAKSFMAEQGYEFPVYYDTELSATYTYGAYSLPTTYFISPDGTLTAGARGALTAETLQQGIDMITKQ